MSLRTISGSDDLYRPPGSARRDRRRLETGLRGLCAAMSWEELERVDGGAPLGLARREGAPRSVVGAGATDDGAGHQVAQSRCDLDRDVAVLELCHAVAEQERLVEAAAAGRDARRV